MDKRKTIKFKDQELYLSIYSYSSNGRLAVMCEGEDEDPYCDITINLDNCYMNDIRQAFIDSMAKDCGLEKLLIKKGIIAEVLSSVNYNMGKYDFVLFDLKKLGEYDSIGYKKYLDEWGMKELMDYVPKM